MATEKTGRLGLSERARAVEPSNIRVMFDLAERQGGDLVRLEIGDTDFDTPDHIVEAAMAAAMDGETHYTPTQGIPALREAIAEKSAREHGLEADPETEVLAAAGAVQAFYVGLLAVADAGDELVLPTPAWPYYEMQATVAGIEPVEVALSPDDGFDLDPDRVIEAIGSETAAVVVSSPSNPTGRVYDPDALRAVAEAARDHGAYLIADDVYKSLAYVGGSTSTAALLDDRENALVVNSCSKQYAMTGWRVGWLIGPGEVIDAASKINMATATCAATPSQHAAVAAMTGPQAPIESMYEAFRERRDYVARRIDELPVVSAPEPEGGFYAFLDVSDLPGSALDVAKRLVTEYGVVTVPGDGFGPGGEGHLRLSFANSLERLETGFDRIEAMVRDEA